MSAAEILKALTDSITEKEKRETLESFKRVAKDALLRGDTGQAMRFAVKIEKLLKEIGE
jgi:hypothetical protein